MDAARLLLFLKTTSLGKLYENEGVCIPLPHDSCDPWLCIWNLYLGRSLLFTIGDIMEKWKELGKRKKFMVCVGVLVVIAVIGWVSGWWSSPPPAV